MLVSCRPECIRCCSSSSSRLSELVKNPYLCQRQIDLFNRTDHEQRRMSSDYVPLLPKDLCQIPLQSIDDEALRNIKKRSRLKDRFPFQLPSFIHKHRFFTSRSTEKNQQGTTRVRHSLLLPVGSLARGANDQSYLAGRPSN